MKNSLSSDRSKKNADPPRASRDYPVPFGDVARSHSLLVVTPLSGFRVPCIWTFLIDLKGYFFYQIF
jgi:hypothetical protein